MPHTPGPWVAQRDWESVFSPDPEELDYYMKRPITAIRSISADKNVALSHDLFEFNPDDARLMAAAPDLLAALKEFIEAHEANYMSAGADDSERTAYDEAMDAARAAIAKAKGE